MKINLSERKIGYTYGSLSGTYSFRSKKRIQFESSVERDLVKLFTFDSDVIDIIEQPMTIHYENSNNRNVTYTPDFLIIFRSKKPWLVEVKLREDFKKNLGKYKERFKVAIKHSKDKGYIFHLFHEAQIRTSHLDNVNFIEKFRHHTNFNNNSTKITDYLLSKDHATITEIKNGLFPNEKTIIVKKHVWHLLAANILFCDLNTSPTDTSFRVWLAPKVESNNVK